MAEFVVRVGKSISLTILRTASVWGEPSRSLVEDLVQATYLKLWEDNCRLLRDFAIQNPDGILGYLKKVAANAGYTCLPTATGGTAWSPAARPEATLFTDLLGAQFQLITHFQSINAGPKPGIVPPLSGNATWQSSLDSSRVWAVKANGIDPDPSVESCSHTGSIQCLLLQSVGNTKGPTGGNLLFKTTFIQRLNTNGGAVPTTACTVGQTQLVPYTADYFFFKADQN